MCSDQHHSWMQDASACWWGVGWVAHVTKTMYSQISVWSVEGYIYIDWG